MALVWPKVLKITSVHRPPFVLAEVDKQTREKKYTGYLFEIVEVLGKKYGFRYEVVEPMDNSFGYLENDSWTGMVGRVLNNESDIGVGPFTVSYDRYRAIDFTVPYYEEPTALLTPPPQEDGKLFAIAKPFTYDVWLGILTTLLILPISIYVLHLCHKLFVQPLTNIGPFDYKQRVPNYGHAILFALGVMSSQSGQRVPPLHQTRLSAAIWCFCVVVIIYLYVGNLMAFLTLPKLRPIVNSIDDLAKLSTTTKIEWAVRKGTILEQLFTQATSGSYEIIGRGLIKWPIRLVDDDQEGVWRVTNGTVVYIKEKSYLGVAIRDDAMESKKCLLSLAKEEFFKSYFALIIPKHCPFRESLNTAMHRMIQAGLTNYWQTRHWPRRHKCDNILSGSQGVRPLRLMDLQSAFLLYITGVSLSLIAFASEFAISAIRRKGENAHNHDNPLYLL